MKQQLLLLLGSIGLLLGVPLAAVAGLTEPLSSIDESPIVEEFGFARAEFSADAIERMGGEEATARVVGYRPVDTNYHDKVVMIVRMDSANNITLMNLLIPIKMTEDSAGYWYAARLVNAFFRSTLDEEAIVPFYPLLAQIAYPRLLRMTLPEEKPEHLPDFPTSDYLTYIARQRIFARTYGSVSMVLEVTKEEERLMTSIILQRAS
ncbi:MAG: hypothetical protein JNJ94_15220 [Chlorobi bacterium]|nr:hypothetical protein [Chlorobiota bacterium]